MTLQPEEARLLDLFRRMDRHGKDLTLAMAEVCEATSKVVPFPNREEITS